ncbi:hypothetical protein M2145_000147 [Lachnospiraceae bacterium PF1-21]|uniref:DUF3149 domain-containing protein n=1 Tax=Ohessyouella blattaphilus TaxID=2949333 RepID=A0ABT1EJ89_9FIRM|nr:hypothetical protein [Ohessyouella blattaphilus]MCP1109367.1 hypothetical protein [Ohessyouella blattaphilus]MCR8562761.1 hypothetical protein [Ohessyouella blattaphilus]MDL2249328.1 hypothetical protein [Lachnospiraceae bacterium OttesenSCG-928-J05]
MIFERLDMIGFIFMTLVLVGGVGIKFYLKKKLKDMDGLGDISKKSDQKKGIRI